MDSKLTLENAIEYLDDILNGRTSWSWAELMGARQTKEGLEKLLKELDKGCRSSKVEYNNTLGGVNVKLLIQPKETFKAHHFHGSDAYEYCEMTGSYNTYYKDKTYEAEIQDEEYFVVMYNGGEFVARREYFNVVGGVNKDIYRTTYPQSFTDFSDGVEVSDYTIQSWIKKCISNMSENNVDRWSIASGNTVVITLKYGDNIQIYVCNDYKTLGLYMNV